MLQPAISLSDINKRTIRAIKQAIKTVSTKKVCKRLGFTQQNLSLHLNEKNAEKANVQILEKIVDAIEAERKANEARALKIQRKAESIAA